MSKDLLAACTNLGYNALIMEPTTVARATTEGQWSNIQVHVKLYSRFRGLLPSEARGEAVVRLPRRATVSDLLEHLGISGRVKLITVNGERQSDWTRILDDGDQVRVLPFAVGG